MVQIAIIGGGIGGLTAALALQQSGFQAEVFEQAPELLEVGAAIAIWSNAMRVLERLQLAEKILGYGGVVEKLCWMDHRGFLLNRVSISDPDTPAVALHRSDLQRTLRQALPQSSIHLGHSLVEYSQQRDKMIATFTNGQSVEAEFLIGADGVHSRMRSQFINDGEPIKRGYTIWRGTSPITPAAIAPATGIELYGRGKRFGIGPVGLGRTGWWASGNTDQTDRLTDLFAGWWAPVLELIEATPPSTILKTMATDREPNKRWGAGRMTLLGDAIHPTTPNLGQGGCQSMEDAVVLARCFEKYGASETALRHYERDRYSRTATLTRISRYYGRVGQLENVWARALRRMALSLPPEPLAQRLMQIVFNYDATKIRV
ncbi:MAG TPA: FAD-dependent monooxygenase [Pyrinomonadaceae bacterium]|nr:FAD-dependent monooxygenase [Pyrinomonadaceae bacterium]